MLYQVILAFFGSVFPAILFNIDRRKIIWAGLSGALGWTVYLLIYHVTESPIVASFVGAFAIGLYSEALARKFKTPAFGFLIPGIFPLVPGVIAYNTLRAIVDNNFSEALSKGILTLAIGGGLAFGIMLSTAIFKFISKIRNKNKVIMNP